MFHSQGRPSFLSLGCLAAFVGAALAPLASADVTADPFGSGEHEFTLEFVTIASDTNPADGLGRVEYGYRMGVYQITNAQWAAFEVESGVSLGSSLWTAEGLPVNRRTWYDAARFVNWLNTSTGHPPAYRFDDGQFVPWDDEDAWSGTNRYRHRNAYYFLPTEDEWVKAAYWNGESLQTYATKPGESLYQGDGTRETAGWNYHAGQFATDPRGPWAVDIGSEELNGTYNMMGNLREWTESPANSGDYGGASKRVMRGGAYNSSPWGLALSSGTQAWEPGRENALFGFRVASAADAEPATIEVAIEIRPGGEPNPINLQARGVLPVAILSTEEFDALSVDEETVLFADPVRLDEELGLPVSPIRSALEDVDGDGRDDLLLFFSIPELVEFGAFDEASVLGTLFGETFDAVPIEGFDRVRIVPPPPARGAPAQGKGR